MSRHSLVLDERVERLETLGGIGVDFLDYPGEVNSGQGDTLLSAYAVRGSSWTGSWVSTRPVPTLKAHQGIGEDEKADEQNSDNEAFEKSSHGGSSRINWCGPRSGFWAITVSNVLPLRMASCKISSPVSPRPCVM